MACGKRCHISKPHHTIESVVELSSSTLSSSCFRAFCGSTAASSILRATIRPLRLYIELFVCITFINWPEHLLLSLVKVAIQVLQISKILKSLHICCIILILLQNSLVLQGQQLADLFRHLADIVVEYLTKAIGHGSFLKLFEGLEQVQLRDFPVVICIEDIKGELQHEVAILDDHLNLSLVAAEIDGTCVVENIVDLLREGNAKSAFQELLKSLFGETQAGRSLFGSIFITAHLLEVLGRYLLCEFAGFCTYSFQCSHMVKQSSSIYSLSNVLEVSFSTLVLCLFAMFASVYSFPYVFS